MDADDTQAPGLMLQMSRMVAEGHDVVIASRYRPGARTVGVPWTRRLLSRAGSLLFRALLPIDGVRDFTCGYRAYRAEVIQRALADLGDRFVDQDGFQCMVDLLLKLRGRGLVFGETPIVLRYDQKEGASKMRVGRTALSTLVLLVRRRLAR
jgi:dolichol-phosphate mannosyltransferase